MFNIVEDLIRFFEENRSNTENKDLFYERNGCKIGFTDVWMIVQEVQNLREWLEMQNEKVAQLEDFVRLLRKENQEIRGLNEQKGEL